MLDVLQWALLVLGLTYLVTEAGITAPIRVPLGAASDVLFMLLTCRQCAGFWVGAVLGACGLYPLATGLWVVVASGTAAMGLMWFASGFMLASSSYELEERAVVAIRELAKLNKTMKKRAGK